MLPVERSRNVCKSQWIHDVCSALSTLSGLLSVHVHWRSSADSAATTSAITIDRRNASEPIDLPESAEGIGVVVWGGTEGTELLAQALSHSAREALIDCGVDPLPTIAVRILDQIGGQTLYRLDAVRVVPPTPGS